jgi:hypothetical protein
MNPIQMSKVEFEMGDSVYCFDEISPAKYGRSYRINGCGDLTWNNATDKEGYGYAVGLEGDYRNLMYFTEEEMQEHFIHNYEMIKIKSRDNKINKLLDLDKYN